MRVKSLGLLFLPAFLYAAVEAQQEQDNNNSTSLGFTPLTTNLSPLSGLLGDDKDCPECPPCFNCLLPGFECLHFANCSEYNGKCNCPPGFGGDDCRQPRK